MSEIDLNRLGVFSTTPPAAAGEADSGDPRAGPRGSPADQELDNSLAWLIRLRWIAGGAVVLATLAGARLAGLPLAEWPLYLLGLGILSYNTVFRLVPGWLPRRPLASRVNRQWFARLQIGADWVATAALIHWTGGIESPAIPFYLFHITIASLLLPHDRGFFYVSLAPALVGAVASEYRRVGRARPLPSARAATTTRRSSAPSSLSSRARRTRWLISRCRSPGACVAAKGKWPGSTRA